MQRRVPFRGRRVWHHSKPVLALSTLILAGYLGVMLGAGDPVTPAWEVAIFCLGGCVIWWMVVLRPRTVLLHDELVVVTWLLVRRFAIADVMAGHSGWHGAKLELRDGSSVRCGTLQTPIYDRLLGRQSRSDRAVLEILTGAAAARGDAPPDPRGRHRA